MNRSLVQTKSYCNENAAIAVLRVLVRSTFYQARDRDRFFFSKKKQNSSVLGTLEVLFGFGTPTVTVSSFISFLGAQEISFVDRTVIAIGM